MFCTVDNAPSRPPAFVPVARPFRRAGRDKPTPIASTRARAKPRRRTAVREWPGPSIFLTSDSGSHPVRITSGHPTMNASAVRRMQRAKCAVPSRNNPAPQRSRSRAMPHTHNIWTAGSQRGMLRAALHCLKPTPYWRSQAPLQTGASATGPGKRGRRCRIDGATAAGTGTLMCSGLADPGYSVAIS